jgi:hypothetical protein
MEHLNKIITAGVGPIIVISACGLLCLALYNRLAAMVTRLRSFHRERLHEHESIQRAQAMSPQDDRAIVRGQEVLGMLDVQARHVTRRAKLIRLALICLLLTVGCLAVCSLALGLSTVLPPLLYAAVGFFVAGMLTLIAGVCFALAEVGRALEPVDLESRFVRDMVERYDGGE